MAVQFDAIEYEATGERGTARWSRISAWPGGYLLVLLVLFASSGASCNRQFVSPFRGFGPTAPQVLTEGATVDQIVAAVNQNTSRVLSLSAPNASITVPGTVGLPLLRGNIVAQRPNRFRLTAGTAVTGQEVDLGSNDELFWLWVRRNDPPAVYFARHDQFVGSAAHQWMPIDPSWLLSALGMVEIDPATVYQNPLPRGNGTVELRTAMPSPSGMLQRVLVIDSARAWVLEQHVYDASGTTLIASAVADSYRYHPAAQVSLPERVSLRLPNADLALTIDLGEVLVNQLVGNPQQLWTMPVLDNYPHVDLGNSDPGVPIARQPQRLPRNFDPAVAPAGR